MYFQKIFYFLSPACKLLGHLQLLSRDLVETNYFGMLLCIHLFLFHVLLLESPHLLFGRETLTTCSLTLVVTETPRYFQVVLKLEEFSHPVAIGTSFFHFLPEDIFSVLMHWEWCLTPA